MRAWRKEKVKILFVQIMNRNFGDSVIAENTLFLLRSALRKQHIGYEILNYSIFSKDIGQVKYVDAIIFAGGGIIKFEHEEFWSLLHDIIFEAQKWEVPVFLNAVGVEGYLDSDERCQELKRAINLECVKCISVRDDMDTLQKRYITNKGIRVSSVFDPAVCSPYTYAAAKKISSRCIGVGVAREQLFSDYGYGEIDRDYLVNFYKELVKNIEKLGYKWAIFTNGSLKDNDFANEVLSEIGYGDKVITPKSGKELVNTIASFKGVVACRMHANIIAYALNIPSIGLVWNDKLVYWGEKIGYSERFVCPDNLFADQVAFKLNIALRQGCKRIKVWQRFSAYKEISYFVRYFCKVHERYTDNIDYIHHVAALGLGGDNYIYRNMNSLETLSKIFDNEYYWVEVDVRLTADNELVCVDGWNKKTYTKLEMQPEENQSNRPMLYRDFKKAKYYGIYETTSFSEFVNIFFSRKDRWHNLIIDIGKPSIEKFEMMLCKLKDSLKNFTYDIRNIYIRLQGAKYIEQINKSVAGFNIIYQLPDLSSKSIEFCLEHQITMVSLKREQCTEQTIQILKENHLDICVFYCMEIGEISRYIYQGVKIVGSSYYDIHYINKLTK